MEHFFSPNSSGGLRSDAHQSQIIGGDADKNHTQIFGGDTVKVLGGIYPPHPLRVLGPLHVRLLKETSTSSKLLFANKRTTLYYTVGKIAFVLNIANSIYKHFWVFHSKYHSCD